MARTQALIALAIVAYSAAAQVRVDERIPNYTRVDGVSGKVRSIGSSMLSNLLNRWRDDFRLLHPEAEIEIVGGGSGVALAPLLEGRSELAPMSRPMSAPEIADFQKKFGYPPLRLTVALDAIAVYVNKDNPIQRLSLRDLDGIFSIAQKRGGPAIRTWGQLGLTGEWRDRPIVIKSPGPTHGMHGVFREMVLAGGEYRYDLKPEPVSTSIVQGVGVEPGGIGFASYFFATRRTHALPIGASDAGPFLAPTQENVATGRYPLARSLFVYVNRKPGDALPPESRAFLSFICSRQGQEVAAREGNYPLAAETVEKECTNLLR